MRPTTAPLHAEIARGPEGGAAHWIHTHDGLRLRAGHWPSAGPAKGTVLLFPGRTEYIEKYGDAAGFFAQHGLESLVIDWRGQGLADRLLSNRLLGHVDEFPNYQNDVAAMVELARTLDLPKPWFLLGHSMGGAIGLRALMEGLPVAAAAFSAPMWGIKLPAPLRPLAYAIGAFARPLCLSGHLAPSTSLTPYVQAQAFMGNLLTNDAEMYTMLREQLKAVPDLAISGPTINWVYEGMRECSHLAAQPSPDVPTLCFLGSAEQIVSTSAIHERMDSWPKGALRIVDAGRHEVLMEDTATRHLILGEMVEFFTTAR
ncbi:alpha/beta hydrolase [Tritonibacter litoralis]|nr:alpha/beta hydrolase [Tritonibacter litoralis]